MLFLAVLEPKGFKKIGQKSGKHDSSKSSLEKGSYIVLPERALAMTIGLNHHVCRFGFADCY